MYTIDLADVRKDDVNIAGGKGANLGELIAHNIPVPEGFAVTTTAYREFLLNNKIDVAIENVLKNNSDFNEIRENIKKGYFSEKMLNEIKEAYARIGGRVAVRSSATAEDCADASFAGQQETYLNISGIDNVLEKIKECFASCFLDRSVEYRKKSGHDDVNVKCAVVIQKMIEADCAGVMFTANVLNGRTKEILINSSYGLGEAVVSGIVNPDQYVLNKDGKIINKQLGEKKDKVIYGDKEVVKVPVDNDEQIKWTLNKNDLQKLCKIGGNIERFYNMPMDIEWAKKNNNFYILQARAITTLNECSKDYPKIKISKMAKNNLSFNLEHMPYAYYPLDYEVSMILANEKHNLFEEIGVSMGGDFIIDDNGIVKLSGRKTRLNKNIFHILKTIKNYLNEEENKKYGKPILKNCENKLNKIENIHLGEKSLKQYGDMLNELTNVQKKIGYARFRYFIFPAVIVGKRLTKYLNKEFSEYDLLSNLPYRTWQINEDLKKLAFDLKKYEYSGTEKSYEEFKKEKINLYLEKHGYKSDYNCYPFSAKCWNENKNGFEKLLEVTMKSCDNNSFENNKYNSVINTIKKNCGKKSEEILKKVDYYRECHMYREESQYMWEKCYALMRRILEQISKKLNINKKDLWFLKFSELINVCEKECFGKEELSIIEKRKKYRKEAEEYWEYLKSLVSSSNNASNTIKGVCGSSGVKTGHACIVLGKEDFSKLKNGDILICNCTSPEWTPLFALASAVVSDTGGALSHAAIVAREYKIPAVLGTGDATHKIKDGDNICVDGDKGRVVLLNE